MPEVPRVVLDTNVVVAAGFRPASAAGRVVAAARAGDVRLVWDDATRRETERIVGSIPPLAGTDLMALFRPGGRYDGPTDPAAFAAVPAPTDRKFAALAAVAGAVLVTADRHLLDGRIGSPAVILTPGEFLRRWLGDTNSASPATTPPGAV